MEGTTEAPQRLPSIVPADQGLTRDRGPLPCEFAGSPGVPVAKKRQWR